VPMTWRLAFGVQSTLQENWGLGFWAFKLNGVCSLTQA